MWTPRTGRGDSLCSQGDVEPKPGPPEGPSGRGWQSGAWWGTDWQDMAFPVLFMATMIPLGPDGFPVTAARSDLRMPPMS